MCGIPYHAVDQYIERLSDKGYKVAIVFIGRTDGKPCCPGRCADYYSELMSPKLFGRKTNNYLASVSKETENYSLSYLDIQRRNQGNAASVKRWRLW